MHPRIERRPQTNALVEIDNLASFEASVDSAEGAAVGALGQRSETGQ
jgi:hypothetical protein